MFNNISITGITPLDYYPCKCSKDNCKQNIEYIKIYIPHQKPDIESINDIKLSICIDDYKIIHTILGLKIVLNLLLKVKIIYTALNEEQSVHSSHWSINFCDFILFENNCYTDILNYKPNLFVGLEDLYVCNFNNRSIELSLLYIICNTSNNNSCCNDILPCNTTSKIYTPKLENNKSINNNTYYCPINHYDNNNKLPNK